MRLEVPTLHLNGAEDPLTRGVPHNHAGHSEDMRLDVIPECGHYIAEERPKYLLERMAVFLAR